MVYILSVNMSSSEHMWSFAELSTITDYLSESNPNCSEDYTIEESMWHIIYFEIAHKTKGLFLVWTLGGFFLAFQLGLVEFIFPLLVMTLPPLKIQLLASLANWSWIWVACRAHVKNKPSKIRMDLRQRRD